MSMNESVTGFLWSFILSSPHLLMCKSWGGVVVGVGSCGGTDSGSSASPHPILPSPFL